MRKILFLFVLLGLVVSCMKRPQPLVYHPKLVHIDSLLQHDSLKWKNLNRGEVIEDIYQFAGESFKSDTRLGPGLIIITVKQKSIILFVEFLLRGMKALRKGEC